MAISAKGKLIQSVRAEIGAPISECKRAIEECDGDIQDAMILLREWGFNQMQLRKKPQNHAFVTSYIHHNNQVGVILELRTETDFCAQTDEVKLFARQLAMHVAATKPLYIGLQEVKNTVRQAWENEALKHAESKINAVSEAEMERIRRSRLQKHMNQNCLLHQIFICDEKVQQRVEDILASLCQKTGEKITISRFTYYEAGGDVIHATYTN